MITVGSTLGDHVYHGAAVAAVFRREVGDHLIFGDCVGVAYAKCRPRNRIIVIRLTVDLVVDRASSLTVHCSNGAVVVAEARIALRDGAGRKQHGVIDRVSNGKVCDLARFERGGNSRCTRFNDWSGSAFYVHRSLGRSHPKFSFSECGVFSRGHLDRSKLKLGEPGTLDHHPVCPDGQIGDNKQSRRVGLSCPYDIRSFLLYRDPGTRHDRSLGIDDNSRKRTGHNSLTEADGGQCRQC